MRLSWWQAKNAITPLVKGQNAMQTKSNGPRRTPDKMKMMQMMSEAIKMRNEL